MLSLLIIKFVIIIIMLHENCVLFYSAGSILINGLCLAYLWKLTHINLNAYFAEFVERNNAIIHEINLKADCRLGTKEIPFSVQKGKQRETTEKIQ